MGTAPGTAPGSRAPAEAVNGRGEDHESAAKRRGASGRTPEVVHPLRAAFACTRDPCEVERIEQELWERWDRSVDEGAQHSLPETATRLAAAVTELRRTAELLRAIGEDHFEPTVETPRDHRLSLIANPRALEVEAIAERVETCLTWAPTRRHPFPPGMCEPLLVPSGYRPEPMPAGLEAS